MDQNQDRRKFIRSAGLTIAGLSIAGSGMGKTVNFIVNSKTEGKRVGIIGLDTSHSVAFTKALNDPAASAEFGGYKIVAAYPYGSKEIKSSYDRIPGYTEDVKNLGVKICQTIADLLSKVDVVLLETNDGRLHLEQALQVIKARKPFFIDKPVAASFTAAKKANVPVFSSSSLRYTPWRTGNCKRESRQGARSGYVQSVYAGRFTFRSFLVRYTWCETLFTIMGTGCKEVVRIHSPETEIVIGTWNGGRIGTFRGTRTGKHIYGGTAFGEKGVATVGDYGGYNPLLVQIIKFFKTGISPVTAAETLEIYAFMEAAAISKSNNGAPAALASVYNHS